MNLRYFSVFTLTSCFLAPSMGFSMENDQLESLVCSKRPAANLDSDLQNPNDEDYINIKLVKLEEPPKIDIETLPEILVLCDGQMKLCTLKKLVQHVDSDIPILIHPFAYIANMRVEFINMTSIIQALGDELYTLGLELFVKKIRELPRIGKPIFGPKINECSKKDILELLFDHNNLALKTTTTHVKELFDRRSPLCKAITSVYINVSDLWTAHCIRTGTPRLTPNDDINNLDFSTLNFLQQMKFSDKETKELMKKGYGW